MASSEFGKLVSQMEDQWDPQKRKELFNSIAQLGSFSELNELLSYGFDSDTSYILISGMINKGNFDELANLYIAVYGSKAKSLILNPMINKGTIQQLSSFLEIVTNPSEKKLIQDRILELSQSPSSNYPKENIIKANHAAETYDAFISHASEDKEIFVNKLYEALKSRGCNIWYDDFALKIGDRLRQSIDKGLANSRYGIVVLSPNFFNKRWPQEELEGLYSLESDGKKVILPVWLDVNEEYVKRYAPMLSGRIAAKVTQGFEKVVEDLLEVITA